MAYKQKSPIPLAEGGTNAVSFTNLQGALVYDGTRIVTVDPGTSGQVLTSNGPLLRPTFQPSGGGGGGITWNNVTSSTQTLAIGNGYIANNGATLVTFTLPVSAAIGSIIQIQGASSGLWTVEQNAGQQIHFNTSSSTLGTGGSVSSINQYDAIVLICVSTDSSWAVNACEGNFVIV